MPREAIPHKHTLSSEMFHGARATHAVVLLSVVVLVFILAQTVLWALGWS